MFQFMYLYVLIYEHTPSLLSHCQVTQQKKWREICTVVNIGTSASAAFTLKKNYIRYLLSYECKFDRGGVNPQPILAQMEAQMTHKKSKRAPSPGMAAFFCCGFCFLFYI